MPLGRAEIGSLSVSRLILGGNPFSAFSHQSAEISSAMRKHYTVGRIKQTLAQAERLGVNTFIGRTDNHIIRMLQEYWDEGGTIQWIAQTAPELRSPEMAIDRAVGAGAKGCFLHGGEMDFLLANDRLDEVQPLMARIRDAGLAAGIASHNPKVFQWARDPLDVDFCMGCYYNPSDRSKRPQHVRGSDDRFRGEDRDAMAATIQTLAGPAIHYKILAAGRNDPQEAFAYSARHMRPNDAVCVGIFTRDHPMMIKEDIQLLEESLAKAASRTERLET